MTMLCRYYLYMSLALFDMIKLWNLCSEVRLVLPIHRWQERRFAIKVVYLLLWSYKRRAFLSAMWSSCVACGKVRAETVSLQGAIVASWKETWHVPQCFTKSGCIGNSRVAMSMLFTLCMIVGTAYFSETVAAKIFDYWHTRGTDSVLKLRTFHHFLEQVLCGYIKSYVQKNSHASSFIHAFNPRLKLSYCNIARKSNCIMLTSIHFCRP